MTTLSQAFRGWLTSTPVLRLAFGALRTIKPVAVFGKNVFVTRYPYITDILKRENDFTVYEIDGYRMEAMGNAFVLGMDASPEATRDRDILYQVIKRDDLGFIQNFIRLQAHLLIETAKPHYVIDVVNAYARVAAVRLVDGYFGVPADTKTMMRWQRDIFNEAFVNLNNDPTIHERGMIAGKEIVPYLLQLIKDRKQQNNLKEDNILNRLILKQPENPWLDDDAVRRNIACILGVVENISKVVTHVIDQFLKRPEVFAQAKKLADSGDMENLKKYCFEALRFNPHNPAILRYCKNGAVVAPGTKHEKRIKPGSTIYAATLAGMFDPGTVKNPKKFDPERNIDYLHFGIGPHVCMGKYISAVAVPELVAALLRLKNLRRAPGKQGRIKYDQVVFPDRLMLEFD